MFSYMLFFRLGINLLHPEALCLCLRIFTYGTGWTNAQLTDTLHPKPDIRRSCTSPSQRLGDEHQMVQLVTLAFYISCYRPDVILPIMISTNILLAHDTASSPM